MLSDFDSETGTSKTRAASEQVTLEKSIVGAKLLLGFTQFTPFEKEMLKILLLRYNDDEFNELTAYLHDHGAIDQDKFLIELRKEMTNDWNLFMSDITPLPPPVSSP